MIDSKLKKGLGRGLSSLLGDNSKKVETNKVPIKDINRSKFQPRKNFNKESLDDLTNSIKERGVIQPIIVRSSDNQKDKYEREPKELIVKSFLFGCLGIIPAIFLEIFAHTRIDSRLNLESVLNKD